MASPRTSDPLPPSASAASVPLHGSAVRLFRLTRVFGLTPAVVRVDLDVERGETVLIRGPNGAGKTSLLRLIATAITPTYGSGSVMGFDLVDGRMEIRQRTELVGHRTRLYEDLTAWENLRFACALHGLRDDGVRAALDRVGLADASGDRVRAFSQGMRQRLALSRLMLRAPDLALLDEPYAGLDDHAKDMVDEVIADARAAGRTVLLATHDPSRGGMADRTVRMDRGRILP